MMPAAASSEHQAMLRWPRGATRKAPSSGPKDEPRLPPTWNNDCASPYWPPEAMRATRDDSGWKIDDPIPISPAAVKSIGKVGAADSSSNPRSEQDIEATSAN